MFFLFGVFSATGYHGSLGGVRRKKMIDLAKLRGHGRKKENIPSVLEEKSERARGVKRGVDETNDGMECVFDAEVMDRLWTHEDLCSIVTYL